MHKGKLIAIAMVAAACGGGTPTNFAGTYTITVVNGANDCNSAGWTQGDSSTNITAQITQDGTTAQLQIPTNTLAGAYLLLAIGTNSFAGIVQGDDFTATLLGTKSTTQGGCIFTINTKLDVTLDTNGVISGTLTYTPATNHDASCGTLETCSNQQTVSGSRTSM
jgi:hypothetical protein